MTGIRLAGARAGVVSRTNRLEEQIMDLYEGGKTVEQIAQELGRDFATVYRIVAYMKVGVAEKRAERLIREGSIALASAIAATGKRWA